MPCALSTRCLCALAIMMIASMLPVHAQSPNQGAHSSPPAKQVQSKPGVEDVHSKIALRAKIEDLQKKGFLKVFRGEFDHTQNGTRTLTRFEVAVMVQRMGASIGIRALTQDSTKLEVTFGFPGNLELKQAQEMLDLWTEFGPEIKQLGVEPNQFQRVRNSLELYIVVSTPNKIPGSDKASDGKSVANPSSTDRLLWSIRLP